MMMTAIEKEFALMVLVLVNQDGKDKMIAQVTKVNNIDMKGLGGSLLFLTFLP